MTGHVRPHTMEVTTCARCACRSALATSLAAAVAAACSPPRPAPPCHTSWQPGETLWSIAAANNLTTRTVAAFNGLSEDSQVVLGQTIQVPTTVEGYAALVNAGLAPADPAAAAAPRGGAAPDGTAPRPPARRRPAATSSRPRAAGPLQGPPGRHARRPGRLLRRLGRRDGRHERPRPVGAAADRHGAQAARAARPRRRSASTPEPAQTVVPAGRPGPDRRARRRRRRPVGRRRCTASPPRSPPRSRGRRAASTTRWSPPPTRAA